MSKENLYKLGRKVGLNKNDIDKLLKHRFITNEHASLSYPDSYKDGTWYGTISIKDF
jgi:hypothetical protein